MRSFLSERSVIEPARIRHLTHPLSQLSALREISLAKELHDAGVPQLKHLYMGQNIVTSILNRGD
jgi:hypothetical protein